MNCVELHQSLVEIEDGSSAAQKAHLKSCAECSALVAELNSIASAAVELRGIDEPSPRVWNSIEIALRQEGIIRPQGGGRSLLPALASTWGWSRWLVPAAAALLVVTAIYLRDHSNPPQQAAVVPSTVVAEPVSDVAIAGLNDDDLLQEISVQSPALRTQYADNLRRVNEYIHDAQDVVSSNPNDEEARRSLMEAYQQKAMLFELAMDRSLP